ncbi:MAG: Ldh family oxidoreductase [Candidatus Poribacteria bacterium]|nr:Ldh family oxidoreductase [Candidatus Poribacteria bacterium]
MHISIADARQLAETFLTKSGMPSTDATIIADILLEAELRGRKTHGFIRLTGIKNRYKQGERTDIQIDEEKGQCVRVNGGNQPGYLVAYRAMELAIARTKQTGASIVGVYNTSHCGMAGYYVDMARKADIIGLLFADCLPRITPEGGTEAILGTNPIAVGIPSNTVPLLFDMSTAAITNGDLLVAMQEDTPIVEGIAFDPDGAPTTSADAALKGSVRPFGGHKGFGLALITQILAGVLVNAATIPPPGTNYGLLIIAIDPTGFVPLTQFKAEVDALIARVKENRLESGVTEILIPGERAYRQREIHLADGIHLDDTLVNQLTC